MLLTSIYKEAIERAIASTYPAMAGFDVVLEVPPNLEFGDLATPLCLKLARELKQNPLQIAESLAEVLRLMDLPCLAEITITRPGYINFKWDYAALALAIFTEIRETTTKYGHHSLPAPAKIVIEHTNINPNKAAHIGHLRNSCLGDTLARMLKGIGYDVEVQNYIDDTGTAVADIVVGMEVLGWQEDERSYDYFCWDLYTAINDRYTEEPDLKKRQLEVLHLIEEGNNPVADLAKQISIRIVECHLATMARLDIFYNLLTWESDILHLGFWQHAFNTLKGTGGLVLETEGANAGCWVVKLGSHKDFAGMENPDKVIVRSNGTATYVAKDIANQMWKFGILGKDFSYKYYSKQANGQDLWTGVSEETPAADWNFGHADRVINVIDIRQKYLQDVLRVSFDQLGFHQQSENSIHFGYEVVTLSADAARELGVKIDEEEGKEKEIFAMSGRKGIGVKADDLVERLLETTTAEVARRHEDYSEEEVQKLALDIAVAAIRYYMQRYNMSSLIIFDFKEALTMEGNSGPYIQYAHARVSSLLRRAKENGLEPCLEMPAGFTLNSSEINLIKRLAELPEILLKATDSLQPSVLAEYAYQLAASWMSFYDASPVLNAPPEQAGWRLALAQSYKQVLANTLTLLGIPAIERM